MSEKGLELFEERLTLIDNAIKFKENSRVPIYGLVSNWMLYYLGMSAKEALANPDAEREGYNKAVGEFKFDALLSSLIQLPSVAAKVLGGGSITDNESDVLQIRTSDSELMGPDEYDELIADPVGFMRDKIMPRRHEFLKSGDIEAQYATLKEFYDLGAVRGMQMGKNEQYLKEELGVPVPAAGGGFMPTDIILDYLRDFSGIMVDIRRQPEKVCEASLAMLEPMIKSVDAANPVPRRDKLIAIFTHIPGYISPKAFEIVYWPQFKKYLEHFSSKGHRWMILYEKNWEHLYDFLLDSPKKSILGFFEEDDIFKGKKVLEGSIAFAGGIRTNDLYYKSKQENIDIVKRVIDECAPGGGLVLAPDKVMHTNADGKTENLQAVIDFAQEYGKYK
ncbi:MAG: hypothetical protein FWG10_06055 [Eubacteriaceae bacterium]|nr:hypothetical protein [Eubacteriaceae bacterium]